MKRRTVLRITVGLLSLVLMLVTASCGLFPSEDNIEAPALKTPKPVEYHFYQVVKGDIIKGSSGTGSMTSVYYYEHSFPTSGGYIKSIYVTMGQYVNKGDLLVETDNSSLELDYLQASIDYTKAKEEFDKQTASYNNGGLTDTEYRICELEYQYVATKYEHLKSAFENTQLVAQVSGKVVYLNTSYTTNTDKEIVAGETIVAIDSESDEYMYLVFDKSKEAISDSDATPQQFRIGTVLTLQLQATDSDPNPIQFEGVIVGTDQIIKDTGVAYVDSSRYYCKITSYPDYGGASDRTISSGTIIRYTYIEDARTDVLIIPLSTVYEYNGKHYVYMLDATTNLKKEVYVELGLSNDSYVEVVSGLKKGEMIITD